MPERAARRLRDRLDELEAELARVEVRNKELLERVRYLREGLERGERLVDLVRAQPSPSTVGLMSANVEAMHDVGARMRAAHARTLRAEGLTIEEIAEIYGVSRQRVSALLRQRSATDPDDARDDA